MTNDNPPATAAGEHLISARGIRYRRGGRDILLDVNLDLDPQRIVTLIGPNGAGKSTLVRILLGLERADSGRITRRPGLRIGYMPQRLHIDPKLPLSVERFLRLTHDRRRAIKSALETVEIPHLIDSPLHSISGGELQRALLARALVRDPDLMVLDEPAQGVDLPGQAAFYDLIENLQRTLGCAVLMISHDLHWVMARTNRVLCLNQHICCSGHPEQVSNDPAYLSLFGHRHATAVGIYQHDHDHEHAIGGDVVKSPGEHI